MAIKSLSNLRHLYHVNLKIINSGLYLLLSDMLKLYKMLYKCNINVFRKES